MPENAAGTWRAFDAAANRAAEGLRVIEDIARFALDDAHLTGVAKRLRHDLAGLLAGHGLPARIRCRDVDADVGPGIADVATLPRSSPAAIVAANAARAAQGLRTLQECASLLSPALAPRFESLRYRLYALERAAVGAAGARERLSGVSLCVLVDGRRDADDFGRLVSGLVGAGVRMIQVRDKNLPAAALADRAALAVRIARGEAGRDVLVIVNDRPDVAVAVNADGVHVGALDLPVDRVRRVVGPSLLVGRTAHALDEARAAVGDGADCLGIGPCFPSATKSFERHAPREFVAAVCGGIGLPAFAIGGITLERLDELSALGVSRVAVAGAITGADDPPAMAALFIERLRGLEAVRRNPPPGLPPDRVGSP